MSGDFIKKMKKVISTSLFNRSHSAYHRYAMGAPANARFMLNAMPDWKFRMYYDCTAPMDIVQSVADMPNTEVIEMPEGKGREGCFWRFLAFDDCDIAVCRDLDFRIQENDVIAINDWLTTDYLVHYVWVAHDRLLAWTRKNRRYYMAGCVAARNLPFKVKDLIRNYPSELGEFGADEYFLGEHFMPEILKHQHKVLIHVEPNPKNIPKGKTKEHVEIFPETEEYRYLKKDWVGI
jgi:hypothetical protein